MRRNDFIVLLCVLAASAALLLFSGRLTPAAPGANEKAYLRIEIDGKPSQVVALDSERDIALEQEDGRRNIVHIFPGGFRMAESSCRNQDCIEQGEVTASNRAKRVLYDKVVCLPNKVALTLYTEADEPVEILELTP